MTSSAKLIFQLFTKHFHFNEQGHLPFFVLLMFNTVNNRQTLNIMLSTKKTINYLSLKGGSICLRLSATQTQEGDQFEGYLSDIQETTKVFPDKTAKFWVFVFIGLDDKEYHLRSGLRSAASKSLLLSLNSIKGNIPRLRLEASAKGRYTNLFTTNAESGDQIRWTHKFNELPVDDKDDDDSDQIKFFREIAQKVNDKIENPD